MNKSIIRQHHLGLGDHFVCNGMVNVLSNKYNIYLPVKKHNYETVNYLYCENKNVTLFSIDGKNENKEINNFSNTHKINIHRITCTASDLSRWDKAFYEHAGIGFSERYNSFKLPNQKSETSLKTPSNPYILIHNRSSQKTYDLSIKTNNTNRQYVKILQGHHMLDYLDMVSLADEIHCIDSSFFHLVDSIPNLNGDLFFHDVRKNIISFQKTKRWNIKTYE